MRALRREEGPSAAGGWTGGIAAGLALNSDTPTRRTFNFSLGLKYDPRTDGTSWKLDGYYLYGQTRRRHSTQKASDRTSRRVLLHRTVSSGTPRSLPARTGSRGSLTSSADRRLPGTQGREDQDVHLSLDGGVGMAIEKDEGYPSDTSGAFKVGDSSEWQFSAWAKLTQERLHALEDGRHFGLSVLTSTWASSRRFRKRSSVRIGYMTDYKNQPQPATLKKTDGPSSARGGRRVQVLGPDAGRRPAAARPLSC